MLTNQEKIEIKVRALELAENLNEAKAIYAFLVDGLDDDPLRLDTPSPEVSVTDWLKMYAKGEVGIEDLLNQPAEIDWHRPQLVTNGLGLIIKTNGEVNDRFFSGIVLEVGTSRHRAGAFGNDWLKSVFKYHGEILEKPKITGLNFTEAMQAVFSGKKVRRSHWSNEEYYLVMAGLYVRNNYDKKRKFLLEDFLATDWEIIE
jgi:hypothetical protein